MLHLTQIYQLNYSLVSVQKMTTKEWVRRNSDFSEHKFFIGFTLYFFSRSSSFDDPFILLFCFSYFSLSPRSLETITTFAKGMIWFV